VAIGITGIGGYLPERIVQNHEIEESSGYNAEDWGMSLDEWARAYMGSIQRHEAAPSQATSDLATEAAKDAIKDAGISVDEIDVIVLSTITSDYVVPPSAGIVQANLGSRAKFFQIDSACTGFLDALQVAHGLLAGSAYRTALVVCADVFRKMIRPDDYGSLTAFGDGAAAVVLGHVDEGYGFDTIVSGSEGEAGDLMMIPMGGSRHPITTPEDLANLSFQSLHSKFLEVIPWAVDRMGLACREALAGAGLTLDDVDWVIPHQPSLPTVQLGIAGLGVDPAKVLLTFQDYGLSGGSTVPLALWRGYREGRFEEGQTILFVAMGAGMAWGAAIYRWPPKKG